MIGKVLFGVYKSFANDINSLHAFLQVFYGETPCVSNTREVISGLPTGKLRVMHLALANSRQERAAALAMRAAWSSETVCLAYEGKKVLRFRKI